MYVEDRQSQIRAENGITEKIVGYVGSEEEFTDEFEFDTHNLPTFDVDTLPDDLQWTYKAEMHRMRTGEIMTVDQFKAKFPN